MDPRPLQHPPVPTPSSRFKSVPVPRAPVLPRPPQHLQVPAFSSVRTHTRPRDPPMLYPAHPLSFAKARRSTDVQNSLSLFYAALPLSSPRAAHRRPAPQPAKAVPPARAWCAPRDPAGAAPPRRRRRGRQVLRAAATDRLIRPRTRNPSILGPPREPADGRSGLADIARHVIGCHLTQETRVQTALDVVP